MSGSARRSLAREDDRASAGACRGRRSGANPASADAWLGPVNVPYRQNRAVIFNSDLFHATAPLDFKPGYANRRVNVTMLFGRRHG